MQSRYLSLSNPGLFFGFWAFEKFGGRGWLVAAAVSALGGRSVPLEDGTGLALGWDNVGLDGLGCGGLVALSLEGRERI